MLPLCSEPFPTLNPIILGMGPLNCHVVRIAPLLLEPRGMPPLRLAPSRRARRAADADMAQLSVSILISASPAEWTIGRTLDRAVHHEVQSRSY